MISFTEEEVLDQKDLAKELFPIVSRLPHGTEFAPSVDILGERLCVLAAAMMAAKKLAGRVPQVDFFSLTFPLWGTPTTNPVTHLPYESGWLPIRDESLTHPAILFYLKSIGLTGDVLGVMDGNKASLIEILDKLKDRDTEVILASVRGGILSRKHGHIVIVYPQPGGKVCVVNPDTFEVGNHLRNYDVGEFDSYLTGKYILVSGDLEWSAFADKNLSMFVSPHGRVFPQP